MEDLISLPPPDFPASACKVGLAKSLYRRWTGKIQKLSVNITKGRAPAINAETHHRTYVRVVGTADTQPESTSEEKGVKTKLSSVSQEKPLPMLDLNTGDIVEVIQRWSGGNWYGVKVSQTGVHEQYGFFPTARVRPLIGVSTVAIWDLELPVPCLNFYIGQDIEVLWRLNDWWCWGKSKYGIGLVPLNLVEPCHSGDDHKQTAQKESANGSSRNEEALLVAEAGRPLCFPVEPPSREHHPPSQHYRSCWASTEVDARNLKYKRHDCLEILYKYDDDWWLARKDDQVGLVQANRLIPASTPPYRPYYMRALYRWHPSNEEEESLTFGVDEVINVQDIYQDGYWAGSKHTRKLAGFPNNYVTPILDRRMFEYDLD